MSLFVFFLVVYLLGVLSMAFLTLMERKVLGYMQLRKGPNKVGVSGVLQPFADVIKLLTKEQSVPFSSNAFVFLLSPVLGLLLAFFMWSLFPSKYPSIFVAAGAVGLLCISSVNVYSVLLAGWASNSKYALLGSLRAIAQTISYEVSMALIMLSALILNEGLELSTMNYSCFLVGVFILPVCCIWLVTCLAETNRSPLDFAEGESEIVSGFNVEYSGTPFAFIFMAEYLSIIFMSILTSCLFFGSSSAFLSSCSILFFMFCFIWIRGTLPRVRYDKLMSLTWKCFLPMSLGVLVLSMAMV